MVCLALQVHILYSFKVEGNIMGEIEAIHILVMPEMIWPKKSNCYDRATLGHSTNLRVISLQGTVRDRKTV